MKVLLPIAPVALMVSTSKVVGVEERPEGGLVVGATLLILRRSAHASCAEPRRMVARLKVGRPLRQMKLLLPMDPVNPVMSTSRSVGSLKLAALSVFIAR